jgi:hypothetical protein
LFGKRAKDISIHTTKTNTVIMTSSITSLFVSSLESVDLDQALDGPGGVGSELLLDELLGDRLHCGNILQDYLEKVKGFLKKFSGSPPTFFE